MASPNLPAFALCLFLLVLGTANTRAGLEFPVTEKKVRLQAADTKCEWQCVFTNTGSTIVKIIDIRTDCGCTVASSEKSEIKPGESGVLAVKLSIQRTTPTLVEEHTIQVSTDDNKVHALKFIADIIHPVVATPRLLLWKSGDIVAKRIEIVIDREIAPCELTGFIGSDIGQFAIQIEPGKTSGVYSVVIAPRLGAKAVRVKLIPTFSIPIPTLVLENVSVFAVVR